MLYQIQQLLAIEIKTAFHPYNVTKWMIIVSYKQSLYFFFGVWGNRFLAKSEEV